MSWRCYTITAWPGVVHSVFQAYKGVDACSDHAVNLRATTGTIILVLQVMQSLQVEEVPGMGQFDIDGIDEEDRNSLYGDALAVMSFAFVIILSFGLSYAWVLSRSFPSAYDVDPALQQYLLDM